MGKAAYKLSSIFPFLISEKRIHRFQGRESHAAGSYDKCDQQNHCHVTREE